MSDDQITRTPEMIAEEIGAIKSRTSAILGAAFSVARESCFEIGKRLEEAKSMVGYGNWGAFLNSPQVAYSESTANDLMRIYREFGGEQIDMLTGKCPRDVFGELSQSQMVALFALPPAERITYVEEHREEMEGQSIRELKKQIAEYKKQSEKMEKAFEDIQTELEKAEKEAEGYQAAWGEAEKELSDAKDRAVQAEIELEALKSRPVEAQVMVQPTDEQLEQLRADVREEFETEYAEKLADLQAEADKRHEADQKKLEKLAAQHEKKLAEVERRVAVADDRANELRAEYERRLRAANLQGNVRQMRVSMYLADVGRLLGLICDELDGMEREEAGTGTRMKAQLSAKLDRVLAERGLVV